METKKLQIFDKNQDSEFVSYVIDKIDEGVGLFFYEAYDEHIEVWGESEEDECLTIFLSDEYTIQGIAQNLLDIFDEDINLSLEYDTDNPFEDEDGETIYQKYLNVYLA